MEGSEAGGGAVWGREGFGEWPGGLILPKCTLTVGVRVLCVLSKEGAWCHRRSIALEAWALHSTPALLVASLGILRKSLSFSGSHL